MEPIGPPDVPAAKGTPISTRKSTLSGWLSTLDLDALAAILRHRPDATHGAEPLSLGDLADRLQRHTSIRLVLPQLPLPALQTAEAVAALGEDATVPRLIGLLGADNETGRRAVEACLATLTSRALVWPSDGGLHAAAGFREIWPAPLGLGGSLARMLGQRTAEELRRIAGNLGLPPGRTKSEVLAAVVAHLGDPEAVRPLVARAPAGARQLLEREARHGSRTRTPDLVLIGSPNSNEPTRWALDRGLLVQGDWYGVHRMPREVALALRGPDYHAPFIAEPHKPTLVDVPAERQAEEASASAIQIAEQMAAVLDACSASSPTCLRSGGVGVRELRRVAAASGAPEDVVRLTLELAAAAGLLVVQDDRAPVTEAFDDWRALDPAERLVPLLQTWWELGAVPTAAVDDDGKVLPALLRQAPCDGCRRARQTLVETLARLPAGRGVTGTTDLAPTVVWWSPLLDLPPQDDEVPFATVWKEAERLGVIALGAATDLARALLENDDEALGARAAAMLPRAQESARFGADLTAVVSGSASARLTALLDSAADREARGTASVWRFSPASVRRALDAGVTAEELKSELAAVSGGPLPQPLTYLLADVGRRHGHLTVSPVTCCVRSDDAALLAEVAAHRKLAALRPRLLAPTVLASSKPVGETLALLRSAGYLPVGESANGTPRLERTSKPRAPESSRPWSVAPHATLPGPRRQTTEPDIEVLAARLLGVIHADAGTKARTRTEPVSQTATMIGQWATSLTADEVRRLAFAVDNGEAVQIEYHSAAGNRTVRTVSELTVDVPHLLAWCHLRDAERMFTLSRIRAIVPV